MKKLKLKTPEDILGKKMSVDGGRSFALIVGVVKDFHNYSFRQNIMPICIVSNYRDYQNFAINIETENMKLHWKPSKNPGQPLFLSMSISLNFWTTVSLNFIRRTI